MQGPVLQAFAYDEAHPYAAGQHRGIDIGADAAGGTVVAPAAGTVSFAGTVPTNGKSVTIETADGYSVTLTHLGSIVVARGATVGEGDAVGAIGPSGTPEVDGPYVHLGIRVTSDPNGYLDPLRFLPPPTDSGPTQNDPPASQSGTSGQSSGTSTTRGANVRRSRVRLSRHGRGRPSESRPDVRQPRSTLRPAAHAPRADARAPHHAATTRPHLRKPTRSTQRPVVEAAVPSRLLDLDAGHELRRPAVRVAQPPRPLTGLLPLVLDGTAALIALAAAFAAGRRRRIRPSSGAQVLQLPQRQLERRAA